MLKLKSTIILSLITCASFAVDNVTYLTQNDSDAAVSIVSNYTKKVSTNGYKVILKFDPNSSLMNKICDITPKEMFCDKSFLSMTPPYVNVKTIYMSQFYNTSEKTYCHSNMYVYYTIGVSKPSLLSKKLSISDCNDSGSWSSDVTSVSASVFDYLSKNNTNNNGSISSAFK